MRNPTPKTMRKIKRRKRSIFMTPGIQMVTTDIINVGGSRVDRLPPYEEYNPKRVHVARRRRANQEHHAFPRGWTFENDTILTGDTGFELVDSVAKQIANGGWTTTVTKVAGDEWKVYGDIT